MAGPQLAWAASIAPTIMDRWPVCLDAYGQPGIPWATYS